MKKIKLTPVAPAAPATPAVNVDAAVNRAVGLWKNLRSDISSFGEHHNITKLTRAQWVGAREVIDALGVTDAYLDKCAEVDHA